MQARGITLSEMIIAGTMIAIVATVVVPELSQAGGEPADALLQQRHRRLDRALRAWRADHTGPWPPVDELIDQLTRPTRSSGELLRPDESDETPSFGPYLLAVPANPTVPGRYARRIGSNRRSTGVRLGWVYDSRTGRIAPAGKD